MKSLKILFALLMGMSQAVAMDDTFKGELAAKLSFGSRMTCEFDLLTGGTADCDLEGLKDHKVLIRKITTTGKKSDALLCILCNLQNEKKYKITGDDSEVFFCDTASENDFLVPHGFKKLADGELPSPLVAVVGEDIYVREQRIDLPYTLPDGREGNFKI